MSVTVSHNTATDRHEVLKDGAVLYNAVTRQDAEGWAAEYVAREGGSVEAGEPRHMPDHVDVPTAETDRLISASKVEGTSVYGTDGAKLGSVKSVMLEKKGGSVAYAVLSMGGFLGIGERYHPLPWNTLDYDTKLGGYQIQYDRDLLSKAPTLGTGEETRLDDRAYEDEVHTYYGATPYYGVR